jgi:hypothetical protein
MIPLLLTTADWYGWFWFWPLVPLVWLLVVFLLARFVFGAAAAAHAERPCHPRRASASRRALRTGRDRPR